MLQRARAGPARLQVRDSGQRYPLLASCSSATTMCQLRLPLPGVGVQAPQWRRCVVAPAAASRQKQQRLQPAGGKGFGKSAAPSKPSAAEPVPGQQVAAPSSSSVAAPPPEPGATAAATPNSTSSSSSVEGAELPAVSRGRIFAVCAQVSLLVTALAFGLRQLAPAVSPAVGDGQAATVEALLNCECASWLAGLIR